MCISALSLVKYMTPQGVSAPHPSQDGVGGGWGGRGAQGVHRSAFLAAPRFQSWIQSERGNVWNQLSGGKESCSFK